MVKEHVKKGYHGTVWEVLPTLKALLSYIEEGRHTLNSRKKDKTRPRDGPGWVGFCAARNPARRAWC
jgi:hypothetical protein